MQILYSVQLLSMNSHWNSLRWRARRSSFSEKLSLEVEGSQLVMPFASVDAVSDEEPQEQVLQRLLERARLPQLLFYSTVKAV